VTDGPTVVTNVGDGSPDVKLRYTLNPVNGDPPSNGTVHDNPTDPSPGTAPKLGASGAVGAMGVADCSTDAVSPTAFTAATS